MATPLSGKDPLSHPAHAGPSRSLHSRWIFGPLVVVVLLAAAAFLFVTFLILREVGFERPGPLGVPWFFVGFLLLLWFGWIAVGSIGRAAFGWHRHGWYRYGRWMDRASEIARERFARGEISREQYGEIMRELDSAGGSR